MQQLYASIIYLDDYSDKEKIKNMCIYKRQSFLKYRKKWLKLIRWKFSMKQQHITALLQIKGIAYVSKLKNCTKYFWQLEMSIIMQ